eukprot:gene13270-biopygen5264
MPAHSSLSAVRLAALRPPAAPAAARGCPGRAAGGATRCAGGRLTTTTSPVALRRRGGERGGDVGGDRDDWPCAAGRDGEAVPRASHERGLWVDARASCDCWEGDAAGGRGAPRAWSLLRPDERASGDGWEGVGRGVGRKRRPDTLAEPFAILYTCKKTVVDSARKSSVAERAGDGLGVRGWFDWELVRAGNGGILDMVPIEGWIEPGLDAVAAGIVNPGDVPHHRRPVAEEDLRAVGGEAHSGGPRHRDPHRPDPPLSRPLVGERGKERGGAGETNVGGLVEGNGEGGSGAGYGEGESRRGRSSPRAASSGRRKGTGERRGRLRGSGHGGLPSSLPPLLLPPQDDFLNVTLAIQWRLQDMQINSPGVARGQMKNTGIPGGAVGQRTGAAVRQGAGGAVDGERGPGMVGENETGRAELHSPPAPRRSLTVARRGSPSSRTPPPCCAQCRAHATQKVRRARRWGGVDLVDVEPALGGVLAADGRMAPSPSTTDQPDWAKRRNVSAAIGALPLIAHFTSCFVWWLGWLLVCLVVLWVCVVARVGYRQAAGVSRMSSAKQVGGRAGWAPPAPSAAPPRRPTEARESFAAAPPFCAAPKDLRALCVLRSERPL